MKARTEELLYLLLWSCDSLLRPSYQNVGESFEGWAYRKGYLRQLAELEQRKFLESQGKATFTPNVLERVIRLTESGRMHALGGRDPLLRWARPWDGYWWFVLFDVPVTQNTQRKQLRDLLQRSGFGHLQKSVWIGVDPVQPLKSWLFPGSKRAHLRSLVVFKGRPAGGETDREIVRAAWDFDEINELYRDHLAVLKRRPTARIDSDAAAGLMKCWGAEERQAWSAVVAADPLLPDVLLPPGYLGKKAWQARVKTLALAFHQIREFRPPL
jgi:DNA-binding transcriptional regulator PaaX